ncbi:MULTISPECIES: bacteriohemerythrin [Anaeromyxobacter]|uniref:bacteriohemerythrin n=1 Tax=Anaeromyxobacter TaxID=161492 RepID=UPI001F5AC0E3|nr:MULTISPECIES: bacteriohemerythrin [unclassified Anaeromyxobacter]
MLKWTPSLAVGIVEIDEQHQELFRRAERFVASLDTADRQEIGILLSYLRMYCVTHFGAEEAWMRDVRYEGYAEHKAEHDRFVKDILRMSDEHERRGGPGLEAMKIGTYLSRWLKDHLTRTDSAFARFLLSQSA